MTIVRIVMSLRNAEIHGWFKIRPMPAFAKPALVLTALTGSGSYLSTGPERRMNSVKVSYGTPLTKVELFTI